MVTAETWHRQSCGTPPREPEPMTAHAWAELSEPAREEHLRQLRRWLAGLHFITPDSAAAETAVRRMVSDNRDSAPGAKPIAALSGPNGVGKSTTTIAIARRLYRDAITAATGADAPTPDRMPTWHPATGVRADLVPVVRVNLPASARIKEFNAQILTFLGLPVSGVARTMTTRLVSAMVRHGVQVVFVDDVHLLKVNWKGGRDVLDHLKHINTELGENGATLVMVGADIAAGPIVSDRQISARLELFTMRPLSADTGPDQRRWQRLLADLEAPLLAHLPHAEPGFLSTDFAGLTWRRTQGYLGDLTAIVYAAVTDAYRDATFSIAERSLTNAPTSRRAQLAAQELAAKRTRRA